MGPEIHANYKQLLSEFIKRLFVIFGPDITRAKLENISGIVIDDKGNVTKIEGDPKALFTKLVNQFLELSDWVVRTTIESIFLTYPSLSHNIVPLTLNQLSTESQEEPQMGGITVEMQNSKDKNVSS